MTQDSGAPRPLSPVIAGTTNNKDRTLLIADDDAAFRNRIARALEQRGFIVTAVGSVAEALAQTARPPAFAVLDLRLADGNGLELVGPLRQARPDIRIVVLTGYGNIATAVAAVKEGAVDYLAKPADARRGRSQPADAIPRPQAAAAAVQPDVGRPRALGAHPAASTSCATATSRRPRGASTCTAAPCSVSSPSTPRASTEASASRTFPRPHPEEAAKRPSRRMGSRHRARSHPSRRAPAARSFVSRDGRAGVELQVRSRWRARWLLGPVSPFLSSAPPPLIL
jgi:CheY-like chemotaxis protein